MALIATYQKHTLDFTFSAGTSRGVLTHKDTWIIKVYDEHCPEVFGLGEAAPLVKLSIDDRPDFEEQLTNICQEIHHQSVPDSSTEMYQMLDSVVPDDLPSIYFGLEVALLDLMNGGKRVIFDNAFSRGEQGIPINGLVWMGDLEDMLLQVGEKVDEGFRCIKIKIGSLNFEKECDLLQYIRSKYYKMDLTLRVDANGAFGPEEAMAKLEKLAGFNIHSIEQPIQPGQLAVMHDLCRQSPVPIALDEELIGMHSRETKMKLLAAIKPQYIILKPTLVGGLKSSMEWVSLAEDMNIGWWMTSALESNIGLNVISQFTGTYHVDVPHGLGTGKLYHNNFDSPLCIENGEIHYRPPFTWNFSLLTLFDQ